MPTKPKRKRVRLYGVHGGEDPTAKRERKVTDERYHTYRWEKASIAFRKEHPLCEECKRNGRVTPSEVVDHIVPAALCKDFWDRRNWQALCKKCNMAKGNRDKVYIQGRKRHPLL